MHKRNKPAAIL